MNAKQMKIFQEAYNVWKNIVSAEDLRKNGLTLTDYHIVTDCLREIYNNGFTVTLYAEPVKWFEKHGFKIEKYQTINYKISLA